MGWTDGGKRRCALLIGGDARTVFVQPSVQSILMGTRELDITSFGWERVL